METKLMYSWIKTGERNRWKPKDFFAEFVGLLLLFVWSNKTSSKLYRKRKRGIQMLSGMEIVRWKEERKKKSCSDSIWIFRVIEYRCRIRNTFLYVPTRRWIPENFLFLFFSQLNRQNFSTRCFQRNYLTPFPFFPLFPFSFLSLHRNVNRSKVSYEGAEIKERYLENFPFVNVSTDCRKTFSNFTLPRKPLMTLSLVTLDYHRPVSSSFVLSRSAEQILRHVLRE